jgi:hypothetical protein
MLIFLPTSDWIMPKLLFLPKFFGSTESTFLNVDNLIMSFLDDGVELDVNGEKFELETNTKIHQNPLYFFFSKRGYVFRIRLYHNNGFLTGEIRIRIGYQLYDLVALLVDGGNQNFEFLNIFNLQNIDCYKEYFDQME